MNSITVRHWLSGIVLVLAVGLVTTLIYVKSQADSVTTTTSISNAAPTISNVYISSTANGKVDSYTGGISLIAGTTKTVYVNGTVSDTNGYSDIASVSAKFYRSGVTNGATCTTSNNDCYLVSGCTLSNGSGNTEDYSCAVPLEYYADATDASGTYAAQDWKAFAIVSDVSTASANTTHSGVEVNTLTALSIPSTLSFGAFGLGTSTTNSNNQDMTITQAGNDIADVAVSQAAALTCTSGSIPAANIQWSVTDISYNASGTFPLDTNPHDTDLAVQLQTSGTPTTKNLYWNIAIPSSAVSGSCTGTTTITTLAS